MASYRQARRTGGRWSRQSLTSTWTSYERARSSRKAVLAELEHILQPQERPEYESLEVLPFVRDHVAGLSHVLDAVRAQFADRDGDWVKDIRTAYKQYFGKLPRQGGCGFDVETLNDGLRIEEVWIGDYPWSRISTLRKINRPLRDPAQRLVGQ